MLEWHYLKVRVQCGTRLRHPPQDTRQQVHFIVAVTADREELPLIYDRFLKPFF